MNENIDLTKILKDCPKGTKLYSTIFGEVTFLRVNNIYQIQVAIEDKYYYFTAQGSFLLQGIVYHNHHGECVLFPNKDQRDWSKFTAPWYNKEKFDPKTLQPFDRVIVRKFKTTKWRCEHFSYFDRGNYNPYIASCCSYTFCIPYNDDTKHLVGTNEEAPEYYRYWEE